LKLKWNKLNNAFIQTKEIILKLTNKDEIKLINKTKRYKSLDDLEGFNPIKYSKYITDSNGQTLIHLEELNNDNIIKQATKAINHYYFHTLENPTHRSKSFWHNFIEHFGAFRKYQNLPYISSDMASSHNFDHLECVNNLILALEPLTNWVNQFIKDHYKNLYMKLNNLVLGPFVPKTFGIFPIMSINFNIISDYHWDNNDDENYFCLLVALGDYKGGELCFPQLKIIIHLKPGQIIAFRSSLLLHGNFEITDGIRHSIVYYVHRDFFKKTNNNYNIEQNEEEKFLLNINNAEGLNKIIRLQKAKHEQTSINFEHITNRKDQNNVLRARNFLNKKSSF